MDGKYVGDVRKLDGSEIPAGEWILFRAKDNAVPAMLEAYRRICADLGSGPDHLEGVDRLAARVAEWRDLHPELCKVPD